jgi:hypothetical protein
MCVAKSSAATQPDAIWFRQQRHRMFVEALCCLMNCTGMACVVM